jgi:hypothetical protein
MKKRKSHPSMKKLFSIGGGIFNLSRYIFEPGVGLDGTNRNAYNNL